MYCAGASTDYSGLFKKQRDAHLSGMVVETNRLVIRLEKVHVILMSIKIVCTIIKKYRRLCVFYTCSCFETFKPTLPRPLGKCEVSIVH